MIKRGKTPVLTEEQPRRLLESIKVVKKVTLPAGSHPTEITVSPDKTKIYVLSVMADGSTGVSAFALSSSSATAITTLSGTATAVGRTLIALIENRQRADGSVELPRALRDAGAPETIGGGA